VAGGEAVKCRNLMAHHLEKAEAEMRLDAPQDNNDLKSVFAEVIEARATA
jgi:hypothetical protein